MPAKQKDLNDLFYDTLKDIFFAEKAILRACGRTGGDRVHQRLVIGNDALHLASRRHVHPAQPIDVAAPAAHQPMQLLLARRFVEFEVE